MRGASKLTDEGGRGVCKKTISEPSFLVKGTALPAVEKPLGVAATTFIGYLTGFVVISPKSSIENEYAFRKVKEHRHIRRRS